MQIKLTVAAVAAILLSFAAAAPLEKRDTTRGTVYVCTDANFNAGCLNLNFFGGQCFNMPSGLNDNISSFGPEAHWYCESYTDFDCHGITYGGTRPGFTSLPNGVNDAISSMKCINSN